MVLQISANCWMASIFLLLVVKGKTDVGVLMADMRSCAALVAMSVDVMYGTL